MTTATSLSQFVSPGEVRAVLGVAPEELEDQTLAMPLYLRQLQFDLSDIAPELESAYLSSSVLQTRTAVQQKLYDVMQTYAAYAIAKVLLSSVSLFAPKRITDGKSELERVVDPYQDVRDGVDTGYQVLKERLVNAFKAATGGDTAVTTRIFTYTVAAGLSSNPVTGV